MKFFLLAMLTVSAVMAVDLAGDQAKRTSALKIMTTDPKDMVFCHTDQDCDTLPEKPVCDNMMRLCKPREAPTFEAVGANCTNDDGCRPMYRCYKDNCHFAGPMACDSNAGCFNGMSGMSYQCKILPNSAPGKRCWAQCSSDQECHQCKDGKCRLPTDFQAHYGCCEGFCQKKTACGGSTTSANF